MDRFTNGELDALITAIIYLEYVAIPKEDAQWLESALVKLQAQRKAQD